MIKLNAARRKRNFLSHDSTLPFGRKLIAVEIGFNAITEASPKKKGGSLILRHINVRRCVIFDSPVDNLVTLASLSATENALYPLSFVSQYANASHCLLLYCVLKLQ